MLVLRKLAISARYLVIRIFCRTPFTAKLYYLFFSSRFDSEIQSVLSARADFLLNKRNKTNGLGALRRNIHRIEKGLIMQPVREIFAKEYIKETIELLYNKNLELDSATKSWSRSVLNEYFDTINLELLSGGVELKEKVKYFFNGETNFNSKPFIRKKTNIPTFRSYQELAYYRRSVRFYENNSVDKSIIDGAVNVAKLSPSACNRVPYKYYITENKENTEGILDCAGGTRGFSSNVTHVAVLVGDLSNYEYELDRHLIYIDSSLSAMSFCNALECQGVSSVCINWHDEINRINKIKRLVPISSTEKVIMLIAFGYADESRLVPFSSKKDLDCILEYI